MAGSKDIKDYSKIYYDPEIRFEIYPRITPEIFEQFEQFVMELRKNYLLDNGGCSFFWTIDKKTNSIIIDETTDMVENNIFEQFSSIAMWLFEKDYRIKGYFINKINNKIEYIICDTDNKLISHFNIIDEYSIKNFNSMINKAKITSSYSSIKNIYDQENEFIVSINNLHSRINNMENKLESSGTSAIFPKIIKFAGSFTIGFICAYVWYNCYCKYIFS